MADVTIIDYRTEQPQILKSTLDDFLRGRDVSLSSVEQAFVAPIFQALRLSSHSVLTFRPVVFDKVTGNRLDNVMPEYVMEEFANAVIAMHVYGVGVLLPQYLDVEGAQRLSFSWVPNSRLEEWIEKDVIKGYIIDGKKYTLEDLVILENVPFEMAGRHVSTLDVIANDAESIRSLSTWVKSFFSNGAVPLVLLVAERPVPRSEIDRVHKLWQRMLRGATRAFSTMLLRFGIKPVILTPPMKDMDVSALDRYLRGQIASAFDIPVQMLGEGSTQTAYRYASRMFFRNHVLPLSQRIEAAINRVTIPSYGLQVKFDLSANPDALADLAGKADAVTKLVAVGALSPEVAAELIGLDLSLFGIDVKPNEEKEIDRGEVWESEKPTDDLTKEIHDPEGIEKAGVPGEFIDALSSVSAILKASSKDIWDRDEDDVMKELEKTSQTALLRLLRRYQTMSMKMLEDPDITVDIIASKMERSLKTYFDRYIMPIIYYMYLVYGRETIPMDIDVDELYDLLDNLKETHIGSIVETTRKGLRKAIEQISTGDIEQAKQAFISLTASLYDTNRATLISDTVITDVIADVSDVYVKKLADQGVEYEIYWRTARDERVCPICAPMDGKPKSEWGMLTIPAHPGCRCRPEIRLKKGKKR